MVLSVSAVIVLGVLVWGLWRYASLSLWHIVLIGLFGFLLASTKVAPNIREGLRELAAYLAGIDP